MFRYQLLYILPKAVFKLPALSSRPMWWNLAAVFNTSATVLAGMLMLFTEMGGEYIGLTAIKSDQIQNL